MLGLEHGEFRFMIHGIELVDHCGLGANHDLNCRWTWGDMCIYGAAKSPTLWTHEIAHAVDMLKQIGSNPRPFSSTCLPDIRSKYPLGTWPS